MPDQAKCIRNLRSFEMGTVLGDVDNNVARDVVRRVLSSDVDLRSMKLATKPTDTVIVTLSKSSDSRIGFAII